VAKFPEKQIQMIQSLAQGFLNIRLTLAPERSNFPVAFPGVKVGFLPLGTCWAESLGGAILCITSGFWMAVPTGAWADSSSFSFVALNLE
jgi:hypothetical protein